MAVIHISEEEAARDLKAVLAKARSGEHVIIDSEPEGFSLVPCICHPSNPSQISGTLPRRTLSEAIRLAEARNSPVTLDDKFADDLEAVIRSHEHETLIDPWESF